MKDSLEKAAENKVNVKLQNAAIAYCNANHSGGARTYGKCFQSFEAGAEWQQSQQVTISDEEIKGLAKEKYPLTSARSSDRYMIEWNVKQLMNQQTFFSGFKAALQYKQSKPLTPNE